MRYVIIGKNSVYVEPLRNYILEKTKSVDITAISELADLLDKYDEDVVFCLNDIKTRDDEFDELDNLIDANIIGLNDILDIVRAKNRMVRVVLTSESGEELYTMTKEYQKMLSSLYRDAYHMDIRIAECSQDNIDESVIRLYTAAVG